MGFEQGIYVCCITSILLMGSYLIYKSEQERLLVGKIKTNRRLRRRKDVVAYIKIRTAFLLQITIQKIQKRQRQEKIELELSEAISYLRNAVAMGRGNTMSASLVLEELSELKGMLSQAYMKMLQYLRLNEKEKMMEVLYDATEMELGRDLCRLILQWEELSPHLLVETLESHQKNMREVRITKQKKRDELVSDLIYLPVIINVMLVLINFIYIAYFIDQREALLEMFG